MPIYLSNPCRHLNMAGQRSYNKQLTKKKNTKIFQCVIFKQLKTWLMKIWHVNESFSSLMNSLISKMVNLVQVSMGKAEVFIIHEKKKMLVQDCKVKYKTN